MKKDFIISINLLGKELDELSYEKKDEILEIYLKPKYGEFSPEDVFFNTNSDDFFNCTEILKLAGRFLARLQKNREIFWSFLFEEDFSLTKTCPENIDFILEYIKKIFKIPTLAVFWEESHSPKVIKGSIISNNDDILKQISQKISGSWKDNRFYFNLGAQNPEQAIRSFFNLLIINN